MSEVDTFVDEGTAFVKRHRDEVGETAAIQGGFIWGLMRAVAECPRCPSVIRNPVGARYGRSHWDLLHCPQCDGTWEHRTEAQTAKAKRGARR